MNRDKVFTTQLIVIGLYVAASTWMRRSGRADLERQLARIDEWLDDRRYLDSVSSGAAGRKVGQELREIWEAAYVDADLAIRGQLKLSAPIGPEPYLSEYRQRLLDSGWRESIDGTFVYP